MTVLVTLFGYLEFSETRELYCLPSDQVFRLSAESDVVGEVQGLPPVDNLPICVMAVFGAERRPSNKTLEHDGSQ